MHRKLTPIRIVVLSFLGLIITGGILLMFPFASVNHTFTNPITAFFTSTSAVCVTGLVVVDTGTYWSGIGKFIIISLIQFGGLGYMTIATFFLLAFNRQVSLGSRFILKEGLNVSHVSKIMQFAKTTLGIVAFFEGLGTIALTLRFMHDFPFWRALEMGAFHSVSAFCNAGFDIMGGFKSLTAYSNDLTVNLTVMTLIVMGGIGFYAMWRVVNIVLDIFKRKHIAKMPLHIKIVFRTTFWLIVLGAGIILLFEWNNPHSIGLFTVRGKILAAFFQAITPRTAGFNTVAMSSLHQSTLFIIMLLMFIGGSPGGTAGGIKTTTFVIFFKSMFKAVLGKKHVELYGRTIKDDLVDKAVFIVGFAAITIVTSSLIILTVEHDQFTFLQVMFEVFSAFGTVGLSTGITPHLSDLSRLVIIATMFIGRVGPLSLLLSMVGRKRLPKVEYPSEEVAIG
jgi:trk system potassium uptake protein TrkH